MSFKNMQKKKKKNRFFQKFTPEYHLDQLPDVDPKFYFAVRVK